jgi:hypothetical protein
MSPPAQSFRLNRMGRRESEPVDNIDLSPAVAALDYGRQARQLVTMEFLGRVRDDLFAKRSSPENFPRKVGAFARTPREGRCSAAVSVPAPSTENEWYCWAGRNPWWRLHNRPWSDQVKRAGLPRSLTRGTARLRTFGPKTDPPVPHLFPNPPFQGGVLLSRDQVR